MTMQNFLHFFSQNVWLVVLFFIVLILFIAHELYTLKSGVKKIPAQRAISLINQQQAQVLDIRDKADFKAGHITGAIHVSTETLSEKQTSLDKNKPIIVVCKLGQSACTAAQTLKKQGYTQVVVLAGGITAWRAEGLPLIKK